LVRFKKKRGVDAEFAHRSGTEAEESEWGMRLRMLGDFVTLRKRVGGGGRKAKSGKAGNGRQKAGSPLRARRGTEEGRGGEGLGGGRKRKAGKRESGKWKAEDWEAESENEEGKVGEVEK
jgi:hypothetical protein